jgi:lipid II:glycine glycyltransferase (peptidoglycan interpeptide bridge formation enzyme)
MPLRVRTLSREEHLTFVHARADAAMSGKGSVDIDPSYLQAPGWGQVKADWRAESIGWVTENDEIVGAGLVLYRQLPKIKRYLAYLPEGPIVDWFAREPREWLDPMLAHLRRAGAFTVKMGPKVIARRWQAETIKAAIAEGHAKRLRDVEPDETDQRASDLVAALRAAGWRQEPDGGAGFGDFQPRFCFQLPLVRDGAQLTQEQVLAGFNQLWRRNIRKADKAGVEVTRGGPSDIATFHELYKVTAGHQQFTPRPLSYFEHMYAALAAEDPERVKLYIARHEGEPLAADLAVALGGHVWYSYGGTALHKRELRASNATQWRMIRDALADGAFVYDLRGIGDALLPDDKLFGLIQFKLGTGGEAVEYVGEWDFPVNKLLHKAFDVYMSRR